MEGQTDRQMDGQSKGKMDKHKDGHRDFRTEELPPLSPQRGIENLKSTPIGFYLEQCSDGLIGGQTDRQADRQTDRQTDQQKQWMDGWMNE